MGRKHKVVNKSGIPQYAIERFARCVSMTFGKIMPIQRFKPISRDGWLNGNRTKRKEQLQRKL